MHATLVTNNFMFFVVYVLYIYMVRENPVFVREFKIDGSKKRVGSSLLINVPIADG